MVTRLTIYALSAVIVFMTAFTSEVRAANGLTLSPPLQDLTLGPGLLEASADVTLTNNSQAQLTARLRLVDLSALGQFGGNTLGQAGLPEAYGLANWMELSGGESVVVPAGSTVKVPVRVLNKADLSPGGHYGAVIITADATKSESAGVDLQQQLVSLVFAKKLGGEKYGLELNSLGVNKTSSLPETATLTFKNTGNIHVTPRGYVEVTDPNGAVVSKAVINEDSSLILPGGERTLTSVIKPVAAAKKSGTYKVTAYYRYDDQSEFSSESITILVQNNTKSLYFLAVATVFAPSLIVVSYRLFKTRRSHK